jgi:Coenzyme PQQ synthesis protein D (PqqD)
MQQQPRRFDVDSRRVVHETIDGETILINLQSGNYYSLSGCGSEVWGLLSGGWSDQEITAELERRYGVDGVGASVLSLVDDLAGEGLLEPNGHGNGNGSRVAANGHDGGPFAPPKLEKFTDMQYFLLVDPVHEVEAAGWPHERQANGAD